MYGCTKDQIIGTCLWDLSPPFQDDGQDSREKAKEKIEACLSSGYQFFEWRLRGPDGSIFDVEISLISVDLWCKTFIQSIVRNITDRKKIERDLRESEKKYRTIFENTEIPLLFAEEDSTISPVNKEFEKATGYRKEEVEGKIKWTDFIANKDDLARMMEYSLIRRIDPGMPPRSYEFQVVVKNGQVKNIVATVALIPETKQTLVALTDITNNKKAE